MSHLILVFPWTQRRFGQVCRMCVSWELSFLSWKKMETDSKNTIWYLEGYICVCICVYVRMCWGWEVFFFLYSFPLGLQPPNVSLPKKGVSRRLKGGIGASICGCGASPVSLDRIQDYYPFYTSTVPPHSPAPKYPTMWSPKIQRFDLWL